MEVAKVLINQEPGYEVGVGPRLCSLLNQHVLTRETRGFRMSGG